MAEGNKGLGLEIRYALLTQIILSLSFFTIVIPTLLFISLKYYVLLCVGNDTTV